MPEKLFPTTVVGSYPQPDWLIDRKMLSKVVPRIRMKEMWRIPDEFLDQAQDDAPSSPSATWSGPASTSSPTAKCGARAIRNRFATALEGIDIEHPRFVVARSGAQTPVPRVVGKVRRAGAVEVRDMQFLRRNTERTAKITLPGPFTMSQQAKDEFYKNAEALAMNMAAAVNEKAHDLVRAGADVIQLDEPWMHNDPEVARRYAVKTINRALEGIKVPTVVHLRFGYAAVVPGETKPEGH